VKRVFRILAGILAALVVIVAAIVVYVQIVWNKPVDRHAPLMSAPRDAATVARGEYLVKYSLQCWSCHAAPPSNADSPISGGMVFDLRDVGPGFGLFYTPNITPDSATGIGAWTDGEIVQAIREGIRRNRQPLFPIMPVDWFKNIADDDVLAIVAYLRTVAPVQKQIPASEIRFPTKALIAFGIMGPQPEISAAVTAPAKGPTSEYGQYLATTVSLCADCHTPRNLQNGKFYFDSLFAGSSFAFGEAEGGQDLAFARNITPHNEHGIGQWTEEEFIAAVTAGMRPNGSVLSTHMPYAYYKFFSTDDLRALYLYLQSIPAIQRTTPPPKYSAAIQQASGAERGKLLFQARCQSCHGVEGKGAPPTNVSLADVAASIDDNDLREFVSAGQLNLRMPAFEKTLTKEELDELIRYIRTW
jgi:mono/diheme cytochrome c family protein